jgi:TolB-like protein/DNA-binding winged helix-turn-helix (wHTH) protein/tetratricopeptide (TPR) repeat protein
MKLAESERRGCNRVRRGPYTGRQMLQLPVGAATSTDVGYQVGDLEVDLRRALVTRSGDVLPLPKLSFDLLVALIEAAPGIVSPDELMDRVWTGLVVSPETVSQRVKLLRDALGDDPKSPRYVASVRGRGYRLIAEVRPLPGTDLRPAESTLANETVAPVAAVQGARISNSTARVNWRKQAVRAIAVVAVLGAVLFLVLRGGNETQETTGRTMAVPPPPPRSVAVLPFDSLGGSGGDDVLAFGVAEAVLHRLANLHELEVIARTSSFSMRGKPGDVRDIGRALNVRYLLEGSVQHDGERLRVTAQLVDTVTGSHLWSVQFDETRADIFAMQDEIATQVTRAMQLTLDSGIAGRLDEQSTRNFDAYLAYLQGRALLATGRVSEAAKAVAHFRSALRLDPDFAAAYVSLAEADVFLAEFDATANRTARFEAAGQRAAVLLTRALQLDPSYGPAYLMRGYLEAFSDLPLAESSYRKGLELRPSDAKGYAGLAVVLFEQPRKRAEALAMLEQARRLDPLEPMHDVRKAVFLLYERGDVSGAVSLLREVLQKQPLYLPAITRLGEIAWCCEANPSEAIQYLEQAIALDPLAHWPRRPLVSAYLDLGDDRAARQVIEQTPMSPQVLRIPMLAYAREWRRAGEVAYASIADQLVTPIDESIVVLSIRRHARLTGQYARAVTAMESLSGVRWTADDEPLVPERPGTRISTVGLADMLQLNGETERAQRLLQAVIARLRDELRAGQRSELWYSGAMSIALALSGDQETALAWLERGLASGRNNGELLAAEPAFDGLRDNPRFVKLLESVRLHALHERAELDELRSSGVVPRRY